jgi:hypothetical protein
MKVYELISELHEFNQEAEVKVSSDKLIDFSIGFGGLEGLTKSNAQIVVFEIDTPRKALYSRDCE